MWHGSNKEEEYFANHNIYSDDENVKHESMQI